MRKMFIRIRRGDVSSSAGEHSSPLHSQDIDNCMVKGRIALFCNAPVFLRNAAEKMGRQSAPT